MENLTDKELRQIVESYRKNSHSDVRGAIIEMKARGLDINELFLNDMEKFYTSKNKVDFFRNDNGESLFPAKKVQSYSSEPWTYSLILSIASVASFFLPWFETTSRASYGSQSFSQSLQASPAAALIVYIQWFALSILSAFLAYRRNRFAFLPALLNFYPVLAFGGFFGKHNSIGYSAYGASVSASTHLAYGYWIFAATTILFFLATIGELFKSRTNAIEQKGASSIKEGFIQPKNIAQNKRSLEELKQAKELLDAGAITQEEFDQIKHQALGTKPVVVGKPQQQTEVNKEENPLTAKAVQEVQSIPQKTIESKITVTRPLKQNKNLKWIIGGSSIVLIIALASIFIFKSSNTNDSSDLVEEKNLTLSLKGDEQNGNSIPDFTKSFYGTINNKYQIEMSLNNQSGVLTGGYKYSNQNVYLKLTGRIDGDGNFSLDEFNSDELFTGHFDGKLTETTASGQWSDPSKNKMLPFLITIVEPKLPTDGLNEFLSDSLYYVSKAANLLENGVTVTAHAGLVLRDKPDISGNQLTIVPYGEKVLIIKDSGYTPVFLQTSEKSGYWQKVEYRDYVGFMFDGYLEKR